MRQYCETRGNRKGQGSLKGEEHKVFPSTDLRRKILAVNYSLYWVASVCLAPGPGEQACKLLHLNTTMQEGVVLTPILKEGDLRLWQVKCPHSLS